MRDIFKQILSFLMVISMLAPCVFAAPAAVTTSDFAAEAVITENAEVFAALEEVNKDFCIYM